MYSYKVGDTEAVGKVHALAVASGGVGLVVPVEAVSRHSAVGGSIRCGGITETETIKKGAQSFTRTSTAKTAVENVSTVLKTVYNIDTSLYDICINIPGGMPVEGPSAGVALLVCAYSAITGRSVRNKIAITGELSIRGEVLPVGGVKAKIEAAAAADADTVIIPADNNCEGFSDLEIKVVPVRSITEVTELVFGKEQQKEQELRIAAPKK